MNKKLNIITSAISVFLLILALIPMTMAWFASNKKVEATGMQVKVKSNANLVISDSVDEITKESFFNSIVNFDDNGGKYSPCTHDSESDTGLKYVTNSDQVDFLTGLKRGDIELEYMDAINDDEESILYYYESIIYIASSGEEMPSVNLIASISSALVEDDEIISGSLMATSVDFYLVDNDTLNYCGTSTVANKETVEISSETIPLNTEGYLTVLMRFYFDGEMRKNESKTYINTATVDVRKANISILFTAKEK